MTHRNPGKDDIMIDAEVLQTESDRFKQDYQRAQEEIGKIIVGQQPVIFTGPAHPGIRVLQDPITVLLLTGQQEGVGHQAGDREIAAKQQPREARSTDMPIGCDPILPRS